VRSFSPGELKLMLGLPNGTNLIAGRIRAFRDCERRFRDLVALVDAKSVPTSLKALYTKWLP
jgi:hypothetical protein